MSIQELLTYVEELSFKTSMIGYDKDEVDIQLDKICDEIEAIVKEKDDEIAALRSGIPTAPVVVDLSGEEAADKADKEGGGFQADFPEKEDIVPAVMKPADESEAPVEEDLKDQITDLKHQLAAAQDKCLQAEKRAEAAQVRAKEAENQAEACEARLSILEGELHSAKQELMDRTGDIKADEAELLEEVEADEEQVQVKAEVPQSTDEAYQLYMKNADLLCKQLAAVDMQKDAIVAEANQEAEKILEAAKAESETILSKAWAESERIGSESENQIKEAEEEARRIVEEGQRTMQQDKEDYQELLNKKEDLVKFMKDITKDISSLIDKAQNVQ